MADYRIDCMNLAATKLEEMAEFYTHVFEIDFEEHEIEGGKLYAGEFAGAGFVLVPAELAGVTADQNRVHFDVFVPNIDRVIEMATSHHGRTNEALREDDEVKCIGVFDPDENFLVIKEKKG